MVVCLHAVSMSQTKNSAVDWLKSANTKFEREDYQGAIADYTEAIKLNRILLLSTTKKESIQGYIHFSVMQR